MVSADVRALLHRVASEYERLEDMNTMLVTALQTQGIRASASTDSFRGGIALALGDVERTTRRSPANGVTGSREPEDGLRSGVSYQFQDWEAARRRSPTHLSPTHRAMSPSHRDLAADGSKSTGQLEDELFRGETADAIAARRRRQPAQLDELEASRSADRYQVQEDASEKINRLRSLVGLAPAFASEENGLGLSGISHKSLSTGSERSSQVAGVIPELWPVWCEEPDPGAGIDAKLSSSRFKAVHKNWDPSHAAAGARVGDMVMSRGFSRQFMVRPSSSQRMVWDVFCFLFMAWDLIFLPLMAFDLPESDVFRGMSIATTVFWTLDIFNSFRTGYYHGGLVELRLWKVALRYAQTWLLLDVIVVAVDWLLLLDFIGGQSGMLGMLRFGKVARIARIIRFFRLLRILKVVTMLTDVAEILHSEALMTGLEVFKLTCGIAVVNHLIACGWYAIGAHVPLGAENSSWVEKLERAVMMEGGELTWQFAYASSLHWSITQFTPASMEVVPRNLVERSYAIVVILFAMVSFSTFVSSITSSMTHLRNINYAKNRQQEFIRRYITENKVSLDLGNRIQRFLQQHHGVQKKRVHEKDIAAFASLPEILRTTLHLEVFKPVLDRHPFFHQFIRADICGFAEICHGAMSERSLMQGEELFCSGEEVDAMFFVRSGNFQYTTEKAELPVTVGGSGFTCACEMSLWVHWECVGRLLAQSASEIDVLDAPMFRRLILRTDIFTLCQSYARLYSEYLASGDCNTDVWTEQDGPSLTECAHRAFRVEMRRGVSFGFSPSTSAAASVHTHSRKAKRVFTQNSLSSMNWMSRSESLSNKSGNSGCL